MQNGFWCSSAVILDISTQIPIVRSQVLKNMYFKYTLDMDMLDFASYIMTKFVLF